MISFVVDERVQDMVRALLPKNVTLESIALADISARRDGPVSRPALAAVALAGHAETMRAALAEGPDAQAMIVELDPARPEAACATLLGIFADEVAAAHRRTGEARAIAAQFRADSLTTTTRLREIENLLYSLGNPQLVSTLAWPPTGRMLVLEPEQSVEQALPLNAVSLSAIDLWFPQVVLPQIGDLAAEIRDASGQAHVLYAAIPDMGIETGWVRFVLDEPVAGVGRDCRLRLSWTGGEDLTIGLGLPVPDPRFRAGISAGTAPEETLALRVWQSLGGVRLPACTPAFTGGGTTTIRRAEFVLPSALPRPEVFALPMTAQDHVSTDFWSKEDAIFVHPSRQGAVCAIIRGVDLAGLSHVAALVTVGHARAPNLNFAIGVAPHGRVDEDGFWQRRLGPWVTGLPARGWGQAHCIPVEPITGKADILMAVSLATDVPNDLSWGLFRGFRFSRGDDAAAQDEAQGHSSPVREAAP